MAVTLLLAAGSLLAAENPAETGAFNSALRQLSDGFWPQAEAGFVEITQTFTNSARLPEAFLYQAQARYQMTNYAGAIDLLLAHQGQAGVWADQYLFWLGQACLKKEDFAAAGAAFARVVKEFPGSSRCLEAALGEATASAKRADWRHVVDLLQRADGVFQSTARTNATSEPVVNGFLLLAEALFAQRDYPAADAILEPLAKAQVNPKLAWQLQFLRCRLRVAQGRAPEALQNTSNLLTAAAGVAAGGGDRGFQAESFAFQAALLEQLGQGEAAMAAYTNNLADGIPAERQSQALMKVTELFVARNKVGEAAQKLEEFSLRNTNAPATGVALLLLGELRLRQFVTSLETNLPLNTTTNVSPATNNLQRSVAALTALIKKFPQSHLVGKAQLDLGWCLWLTNDWPGCQAACQAALERLPISPDHATARFKLADAQFEQKNYAGAVTNYNGIIKQYAGLPEVETNLFERALYQTVRAGLDGGDLLAAGDALGRILTWYPDGFHTERAYLLAGQTISRRGNPAGARAMLTNFVQRVPGAKLAPQICLTVARTYEQENKWPEAIQEYTRWLERFTNCDARPRAEYSLALAYSQARNETNALTLLTNFVARYATNELAPLAQWWIGDYYYRNGPQVEAERTYKLICQNTNLAPSDPLIYQARMMAGRAAVACQNWPNAINHFTNLTSDAKCPREVWQQAMFAYGDALMSQESTNRQIDYEMAIDIFRKISDTPTNRLALLALGEKAIAYSQWAELTRNYYALTNALQAYQQVLASSNADISARSMALVGQGIVLEKQSQQRAAPEKKALLEQALDKYLAVFYEKNLLLAGEQADSFWVKKAGLEAARLLQTTELQNWQQAINVYERLKKRLPPLSARMDKEILKAREKAGAR